ncbi:tetratricopeptide repeat protein [Sulfurimonas lithotrophica]|nr:tetratricopeptide repeat protein [Sulfurimonas lithotrophica]
MKYKLSILLLLVSILNAEIKECFLVENKTEFIGCLESEVKKSDSVKDTNFLASIYVNDKEYEKAIKLYEKSVEKGDVKAMYYLGGIYNEALKDYDKALYWFERSYEYNYKDSSAFVAEILSKKFNNNQEAVKNYLQKRIDANDSKAYEFLGAYEYNLKNYKKAIDYYKKAVKAYNSPQAMYAIGSIYYQHLKDTNKGMKWLKKASKLQHPDGVYSVGFIYKDKKEYKKAIEWFNKALDLGVKGSHYAISECYRKMGEFDKAKEQYLKMVKEGNIKGYREIGVMYSLYPEIKDEIKEMKWYERGIEARDGSAAAAAAVGFRDKKDYENFLKYNKIAYSLGYAGGANEIAYYYLRTVKDEKKAIEWGKRANRLGDPMFLKFLKNIGVYDE